MSVENQTMHEFLEAVASKQPTPGGGAVASLVAALGAALGQMVVNYSIGKKSLIAHDMLHQEAINALMQFGVRAMHLAEDDAIAYGRLNALWRLDKADPKRVAEFDDAAEQAIAAPHAVLHMCKEMLRLLQKLCGTTNAMLASDLAIAAILAEAGARAAAWNVRINLPLLGDQAVRDTFMQTIEQALGDAADITREIEIACARAGK